MRDSIGHSIWIHPTYEWYTNGTNSINQFLNPFNKGFWFMMSNYKLQKITIFFTHRRTFSSIARKRAKLRRVNFDGCSKRSARNARFNDTAAKPRARARVHHRHPMEESGSPWFQEERQWQPVKHSARFINSVTDEKGLRLKFAHCTLIVIHSADETLREYVYWWSFGFPWAKSLRPMESNGGHQDLICNAPFYHFELLL